MNFTDLIKTVDDDSKKKGDQFEKFCKWFLENDPVWKPQVKQVWLWKDWPDRWSDKDLGIDLVFEHIDGEIWAVQAKCYKDIYSVTKHDMDSFLSESSRSKIQQRLLMASTDLIGANTISVCKNQEKKVTFHLLSDFIDSKLDYPKHVDKLSKPKLLPKPKPEGKYSYQLKPINDVVKGFKKADRGQLIMACGTG
jgi:predicted helicase